MRRPAAARHHRAHRDPRTGREPRAHADRVGGIPASGLRADARAGDTGGPAPVAPHPGHRTSVDDARARVAVGVGRRGHRGRALARPVARLHAVAACHHRLRGRGGPLHRARRQHHRVAQLDGRGRDHVGAGDHRAAAPEPRRPAAALRGHSLGASPHRRSAHRAVLRGRLPGAAGVPRHSGAPPGGGHPDRRRGPGHHQPPRRHRTDRRGRDGRRADARAAGSCAVHRAAATGMGAPRRHRRGRGRRSGGGGVAPRVLPVHRHRGQPERGEFVRAATADMARGRGGGAARIPRGLRARQLLPGGHRDRHSLERRTGKGHQPAARGAG